MLARKAPHLDAADCLACIATIQPELRTRVFFDEVEPGARRQLKVCECLLA
jgi:hypothetical protein